MIIQHNIMSMNAHRALTGNNTMVGKNLEKLSSGYRINRAGDDAAGLAISEKMRAQIKNLEQSQRNAQDGISLVQTAEGALTEIHSMLNRMVELATQASNGTYHADDQKELQKEITALNAEIDRIGADTKFNGIEILKKDSLQAVDIQVGDSASGTISLTSAIASLTADINSTGVGTSAISVTDTTKALAAISTVKDAIKFVSSVRSDLGALQNRLEHTINNLGTTTENLSASESRIRDTDMAKEMMAFTKNNVLTQAAQSMLAQANQQPQQILQLLR